MNNMSLFSRLVFTCYFLNHTFGPSPEAVFELQQVPASSPGDSPGLYLDMAELRGSLKFLL